LNLWSGLRGSGETFFFLTFYMTLDRGDVFPKFIYPLLPEVGDRLFLADDEAKKGDESSDYRRYDYTDRFRHKQLPSDPSLSRP
jgi:hypothetical protein